MKPLKPSLDTLRRRIRKWIDYCIDGVHLVCWSHQNCQPLRQVVFRQKHPIASECADLLHSTCRRSRFSTDSRHCSRIRLPKPYTRRNLQHISPANLGIANRAGIRRQIPRIIHRRHFYRLRNSLFALDVDKPSSQHRVDIQPRLGRQKGSRMVSHPNRLHDHNNRVANPDDMFCRHLAHDVKLRSVGARQRL